jgi:hypothetical protein
VKQRPGILQGEEELRRLAKIICEAIGQFCVDIYSEDEFDKMNSALSSDISIPGLLPDLNSTSRSDAERVDLLLNQWSDQVFHHVFGTLFGQLVGRNGCPLVYVYHRVICQYLTGIDMIRPATSILRQ